MKWEHKQEYWQEWEYLHEHWQLKLPSSTLLILTRKIDGWEGKITSTSYTDGITIIDIDNTTASTPEQAQKLLISEVKRRLNVDLQFLNAFK